LSIQKRGCEGLLLGLKKVRLHCVAFDGSHPARVRSGFDEAVTVYSPLFTQYDAAASAGLSRSKGCFVGIIGLCGG
jgi:hypothetical protein